MLVTVCYCMIDNETFRLRIGRFVTKGPRNGAGSMTHDNTFSAFANISSIHSLSSTPAQALPHSTHHPFLWLFYFIFITYLASILLALTVSIQDSFSVLPDLRTASFTLANHGLSYLP